MSRRRIVFRPSQLRHKTWMPWCGVCGQVYEAPVITEHGPRCPYCVITEDLDKFNGEIKGFEQFLTKVARNLSEEEFLDTCRRIYNDAKE